MIRKPFILKSISLLLSFWMLLASAGLSVDFHYCEGKIVDWSILTDDLKCEHEKEPLNQTDCCESKHAVSCSDMEGNHATKENCCSSNEAEMIIETEFNLSAQEVEFEMPHLLFVYSFAAFLKPELEEEITRVQSAELPIYRHKNLSVNQVFRL